MLEQALALSGQIADVAEQVGHNVVRVESEDGRGAGLGSGILLGDAGEIVTNAHVVAGGGPIHVTFYDGVRRPARVTAADPVYDLALLQSQSPVQRSIAFAPEDALRPGQLTVAVGNPFGFSWTVTLGVISAVDRLLGPLDGLIQTDAAINPGNSGGALVNLKGEVVGIPTAVLAQGQNLGFAIPAWQVQLALEQFRRHGRALHPWLGVAGQNDAVDPIVARLLDLPGSRGVAITEVDAYGPAGKAGLRPLDVIIAAGGTPTPSMTALRKVVRKSTIASRLELSVLRRGEAETVAVRVEELPRQLAGR